MFILNSKFSWGGWWNNKNGRDHEGEAMFYFSVQEKPVTKKKCANEFVKQLNVGKFSIRTVCVLKIYYTQNVKDVQF